MVSPPPPDTPAIVNSLMTSSEFLLFPTWTPLLYLLPPPGIKPTTNWLSSLILLWPLQQRPLFDIWKKKKWQPRKHSLQSTKYVLLLQLSFNKFSYDLNHRCGWIPAWENSEARRELMESCDTKRRRKDQTSLGVLWKAHRSQGALNVPRADKHRCTAWGWR